MYYRSRFKSLRLVIKPARRQVIDGDIINLPSQHIQFKNGQFVPSTKEEEKFLDDLAEKGGVRFWKVTDEDIKIAKQYSKEIQEVNKKYKEKRDHIDKVEKPSRKYRAKRGVSTTENTSGDVVKDEKKFEKKKVKPQEDNADNSSNEFNEE